MTVDPALFEAIARKTCVSATYNRATVKLAPHILYTRNDRLFIDAVTVERDGQPPRETKIGSFQLDGLKDVALAGRPFDREPDFDPEASRYAGATLFCVD